MEIFEKTQRLTLVAGLGVVLSYLSYVVYVYFFANTYPASHLNRLYVFVLGFIAISYVLSENRRSKIIAPAHDLGFFACLTLPLFVSYYLLKSRRLVGIPILFGLMALFFLKPIVYLIWSTLT